MKIHGRNSLREAIKAGREIQKVYVAKGSKLPNDLMRMLRAVGVHIVRVPSNKLDILVGNKEHQGVVAIVSPIEFADPYVIIESAVRNKGMVLIADHIEDPHNLGAMIRSAEVFGVSGVVVPKARSAPISDTVIKSSAGAVFHIPIARVPNIRNFMRDFKKAGGWIAAVEVGGEDISKFKFPFPIALVLGAEGRGVSKAVIKDSDFVISIPMVGKVGSLNVSNACAIALYCAFVARRELKTLA